MEEQPKSWAAKIAAWVGIGSLASLVIVIAGATQVSAFIQANRAALLLWWKIECGILVTGAILMCAVMVWNFWLQGTNALKRRRFQKRVREWWGSLGAGAGLLELHAIHWRLPPVENFFDAIIDSGAPECSTHGAPAVERVGLWGVVCSEDDAVLSDLSLALERQAAIDALQRSRRRDCGETK